MISDWLVTSWWVISHKYNSVRLCTQPMNLLKGLLSSLKAQQSLIYTNCFSTLQYRLQVNINCQNIILSSSGNTQVYFPLSFHPNGYSCGCFLSRGSSGLVHWKVKNPHSLLYKHTNFQGFVLWLGALCVTCNPKTALIPGIAQHLFPVNVLAHTATALLGTGGEFH